MRPRQSVLIAAGIGICALGGIALLAAGRGLPAMHRAASKAAYYCPMHPTYTSDRPGDCPICNMRLVKRDAAAGHATAGAAQKDVCYMHECPMMHEGKRCPMIVVAKKGERVQCPICGSHVAEESTKPGRARAILYWTDPMLPGFKSDKPGKSPMGMDLVPVYEEATGGQTSSAGAPEGYASILVSPQKQQFIGVKTVPVERRAITKTIRTVGQIAHDPALYQAQQEYLQALAALKQAQTGTMPELTERAQRLLESSRTRLQLLGLSDELIEEMANWPGPDRSLLLSDPSGRVWLYATVYEFELPLVKAGQTIVAESPSVPGKTWEGTIRSIDPVLDPTTRAARVRAVLTDAQRGLKPGMFVNATIVVAVGEVLAVPEEAVFNTGTKQVVFVDKGQGLLEPRDVALGVRAEKFYEVKSGVSEGERVITSGNFLIDSESRLKAALEGMSGGGRQHGGQ